MTDDDVVRKYIEYSGVKMPKVTSWADGMASIDGRWVKAGTKLPSGWVVDGYGEDSKVQLSYGGVPFKQDLGIGTVTPYVPPAPESGVGSESEMDEERMYQMSKPISKEVYLKMFKLKPYQIAEGQWAVPQFGNQTFDSMEQASEFAKRYGVTDRTGIDEWIKKQEKGVFGTLSDYWNATDEQRAAGMKIYNNETGDFTDDFRSRIEDPSLDIPFSDDGYIK